MTNFMIGADPELFVTDKEGKAVSAHNLLPGTKAAPFPVADGAGAIQVDGTAAEFNINPSPIYDFATFNGNINKTVKELSKALGTKYRLKYSPVQEYPEEYLKALPMSAIELGCDPDYNAYTGLVNPRPDGTRNFRTAAGHIHIGWGSDIPVDNEEHFEICCGFVKVMDLFAGSYMTLIDQDPRRRELYGKAGAFRPKNYGVEYRTPSNIWLLNKDTRFAMWRLVGIAVQAGIRYGDVNSTLRAMGIKAFGETSIRDMIDNGDAKSARYIVDLILRDWVGSSSERRVIENSISTAAAHFTKEAA